jgi:hypothetical protein
MDSDTGIRDYWTAERQTSAISAETLVQGQSVPNASPSVTEPAVSQPPTVPAQSNTANQNQTPDSSIRPQASTVPYPYPFPWSTVGKVFFTDPTTNTNFVCSGTSVTSKNRSTVDTAGHCVAAGGQKRFYTNWAFCPQYYNTCPSGYLWTARNLWTIGAWYNNGSLAYDYGEAVVNPNAHGYLVDTIGGAGWAYNYPYNQYFYALGFPAGPPFDGSRLWYCASPLVGTDSPSSGPKTLEITCDMTGGSSGGGWLISIKGTFGYTNGHNDYKYTNDPAHMYSPYYGKDWYKVYKAAQKS